MTLAGQTSYYLSDGHSGVRQLINAAGAVQAAYRYDAFGSVLVETGTLAKSNPLLYRDQWFDATIGQYYMRARWYNPADGRFDSIDPMGLAAGDPLLYRYASGNPSLYMDPSGLETAGEAGATLSVGGIVEAAVEAPTVFYVYEFTVQTTLAVRLFSTFILTGLALGTVTSIGLALAPVTLPLLLPATVVTPVTTTSTTICSGCTPFYDYGPLDGMDRATGAFAEFSAPQIRPAGQHAGFNSNGPSWYNTTNLPVPAGSTIGQTWNKGHLIGSKMGGAGGSTWENMVPLYRRINSPWMRDIIENEAVTLALAGECVIYMAVPTYSGSAYYPSSVFVDMAASDGSFDTVVIPNDPTW